MRYVRAGIRKGTPPWADAERVNCLGEDWGGSHQPKITVICDPDDIGGFFPGAEITRCAAQFMLMEKSFTPGTTVHYPGYGELTVVEYTFPVSRGTVVHIRTVQAFKGDTFYLLPNLTTVGGKFSRVGIHGQQRIRQG